MAAKKKKKPAARAKSAKRKPVKKTAKKATRKAKPAKKAKAAKKTKKTRRSAGVLARAVKAIKKAVSPAKKKARKQVVGEGDYAATRKFDKDQAGFVARNKNAIAGMGKAAEAALDGPEGDSLRDAEAAAAGRSRDTF